MTVKHFKNKRLPTIWNTIVGFFASYFAKSLTLKFTENSKYQIDNSKQWNKIIGRSGFCYDFKRKKRKSSKMIVWRYNHSLELFQVAEYSRTDWEFNYNIITNIEIGEEQTFSTGKLNGFLPTSFYFGGRDKPNKDLEYQINFKYKSNEKKRSINYYFNAYSHDSVAHYSL